MFNKFIYISLCLVFFVPSTSAIADNQWRKLDPENTLIIDSSKGRIIIEMRPDIAPKAVERIKLLSREKIYDGLEFHRVVPNFVAQTGNPNNKDNGTSHYPNLTPEFIFHHKINSGAIMATSSSDANTGFIGSVPFQSASTTEAINQANGTVRAWGAHCAGVAGMGRGDARDSANSEIYFMLDPSRRIDHEYTVFGRIVIGFDILKNLTIGEPPKAPDIMKTVRILADIPIMERPNVHVMTGNALSDLITKIRLQKGADFSICDVNIPARIE